MEKMLLPIGDVVLDPRMQAAPGRVVKTYWNAVAFLWHEAKRTGQARLPAALLPDCRELLQRGLALEDDEHHVFIPWVSEAWEKVVSVSDARKLAAAKSVEQRRKAAEMLKTESANAQQPASKRPTTKEGRKELTKEEKNIAPLPRRDGVRVSWLTPFQEAWEARTSGEFQCGKAAKFLHPLVRKHGAESVSRSWGHYLEANDVEHLSLSRFAETYGRWSGDAPPRSRASPSTPPSKSRNQAYADRVRAWATGEEPEETGAVIDITPREARQ